MLTIYLNNTSSDFEFGVVYYIKVVGLSKKMNFISINNKVNNPLTR
ncbi:MAG: hypothetical protein N4A72_09690 [Bacteroidales bacterium]|jgi:hypothetical protein|nr:hypothetical protein [Bacteroidales bacterium]